jgi:Raf kinase inhibitor-like YbhB/YbcL family protein
MGKATHAGRHHVGNTQSCSRRRHGARLHLEQPECYCAGRFTITSSSFKDGERLATKMAGNNKQNPNCVGENVSPALSWSNPPAGTKSYALIMYDPEGRGGLGVVHWVAYGIPASVTGFAEGDTSQQVQKYVGGKSTMNLPHYFGPCTPAGVPHHYTFTLIARLA